MKHRIVLATLAALFTTVVTTTPANAAKGYEYQKCSSKSQCEFFVATNSRSTKVLRLWITNRCTGRNASFTGNYNVPIRVSRKQRFSIEYAHRTYEGSDSREGKIRVVGKVTKKNKVTLSYEIEGDVVPGCSNVLGKHKATLKYKGSKSGY